jgi:hypothetical protein
MRVRAVNAVGSSTASNAVKSATAASEDSSGSHKSTFADPGSKCLGAAPFTVSTTSSGGAVMNVTSTTPQVYAVATGTCALAAESNGLAVGSSTALRAAAGPTIPAKAKLAAVSKTPKVCKVAKGKVTALKAGTCRVALTARSEGKARKLDLKITTVAK